MNKMTRDQKGAAMLEFVIVLPFLLMLTFGIIEFSNLLMKFNTLNKITMDASRYLVTNARQDTLNYTQPISPTLINQATYLMNCGKTTACSSSDNITLDSSLVVTAPINSTGLITTTVTYSYQSIFNSIFGTNINLNNRPLTTTIVAQAL